MNYFKLIYSTDFAIIGSTFPQSQNFKSLMDVDEPRFLWNNDVPFPKDVYIPNAILHPKAKFTDLISSAWVKYPLISQKLQACIKDFGHNSMSFFQTKLLKGSLEKEITMICGKTKGFEFLDFQKTEIDLLEKFKFFKRLSFGNVIQLEDAVRNVQYPNTIAISSYEFQNIYNHDIFYIANFPRGGAYFFSERLKQAIIDEGFTGIEFEKVG